VRYSLIIFILILAVSPHIGSGPSSSHKLKFGFNPSNSPPLLYQFENETSPIATGGLIFEMSVAIAEELDDDYTLVRIPRKRIPAQLNNNKIDLICHNSIAWGHAFNDEVVWSKPLYSYANVLVGKKEIPFTWPEQVANVRIGTVENFMYNEFEPFFKTQILIRDDAPSVPISLKKLLADRVDYIVMSEVEYNYHKARHPELHRSSFVMGKTEIRCSLSKKSALSLQRLNRAIDQLLHKKTFQKIYDRYLDPKSVPEPFSYGLNGEHSPPFLLLESEVPLVVRGGLFFEIGLEVAKRIKRPVTFVLLPRGRLDARLAEGQIVLVCYNNEVWAGEYAKMYDWSIPIFRQSNYIVGLKGAKADPSITSLVELKGKRVGTTLNFVYPAMTPYFDDGSIIREDAGSGSSNVEKLIGMRVPYILLNNLEYAYHKKLNPKIERAPLEIDPVEVKCAVSKKSDLKIEEINAAIMEMKRTGVMQRIFFPR
jgi:ABC-type amino acid transport substrate-binding protein